MCRIWVLSYVGVTVIFLLVVMYMSNICFINILKIYNQWFLTSANIIIYFFHKIL